MNSKRIITFFLVFLLIGVPLHAQYHFEHFDSRDGLSQTSIRTMIQDSTGYIWMGTFGGLIRYDGYNFKTYSHNVDDPQSLPNDDVTSLVIDDHQNLWIGTTHGLAVMNLKTHKFKNYHVDPPVCKLVDESIRSLFIDDQKRIWIGTKNKGVCYFDATLNQFVIPPLPRLRNVRSFIQSTDGSIYYSSFNEGIQRFKLTKDSSVLSLKNYPIEKANIRYLYHEQDTIYAGTNNGLYRKYPVDSVFTRIPQPNGHYDFFRSIAKTKEGYWLGTLDGLIYCTAIDDIQTGQYERYFRGNDPASIMSNSYIFSLFQDRSRQLWIGTEDGLESYDFFVNQFKRLKKSIPSGDYVPHVTKINRLSSGQLLLGTRYPGLLYETDKTFERYLPDTHEVTSIERVDESHYYIGLGSGSVLDLHTNPKHVQTIHLPNCETSVYTLTKIDENRILCGTRSNGLYLYDIQKQKAVAFRPSIFY